MITTNDPAGTAIVFKNLVDRHTEHECRLITTETRYNFAYRKDLHVPALDSFDELAQVLEEADVFHFHMVADESTPLGPFRAEDFRTGQPVVHHHHGEPPFRADPRRFAKRELSLGRSAIVSTPDLLHGYPEATWIPNAVPLEDPDYQPLGRRAGCDAREVVVGHSPTRQELKNTAEFLSVMEQLASGVSLRDSKPVTKLITNTPHLDCLEQKRACDLFFDHMQGYFGVSSLEALAQGVPTLAGLDDHCRRHVQHFTESSQLPWIPVTSAAELYDELERLISDSDERRALGAEARRFMERHWTEAHVARRLEQFYARL